MRTFAFITLVPRLPRPPLLSRVIRKSATTYSVSTHRTLLDRRTFHASREHPTATMPTATQHCNVERGEALRAVAVANTLARRIQSTLRSEDALVKSDSSPVTVADYSVQCYIVSRLHAAFPRDRFIAEETSTALRADPALLTAVTDAVNTAARDAGTPPLDTDAVLAAIDRCDHQGGDGARTWMLDPIDGTRGYVALRQYCIALALTEHGSVQLGVLGCPNLTVSTHSNARGVVFHAVRGGGSHMLAEEEVRSGATPPPLGRRVFVSDIADPVRSVLCESVEKGHSSHELSARVAALLQVAASPLRMDSQAKYGCMARGDANVFLRFPRAGYIENVWDHAAGAVVIEEAGGRVTDGRGRALDFSRGRYLDNDDGIVASNGLVHDAVIAAVQKAISESQRNLTL